MLVWNSIKLLNTVILLTLHNSSLLIHSYSLDKVKKAERSTISEVSFDLQGVEPFLEHKI